MSQSISSSSGVSSASGTSGTSSSSSSSAGNAALNSLTDNYQTFLQMLLTQLQNQDPTSPMDSGQFTTELVQFAGVEQQINTNSNLTQLIQLTQDNATVEATQMVGKQVDVTSSQLALQNGKSEIQFNAPLAEPIAITVSNASGQALYSETVDATAGANTWTWNGQTAYGTTEPDGAYTVTASAVASDGTTSAVPFSVVGTVTGVTTSGSTVTVNLGSLSVNMTAVTSVGS
jgi:flagellar basal-body rod modification protein FlgD